MKNYDSHILVGNQDRFGGYNYNIVVGLILGDFRPSWVIEIEDGQGDIVMPKTMMIPTLEHIIEDGMLVIAYAIEKNASILELLAEMGKKDKEILWMYDDFTPQQRDQLYANLKTIEFTNEFVFINISQKEIEIFKDYNMEATFLSTTHVQHRKERNA